MWRWTRDLIRRSTPGPSEPASGRWPLRAASWTAAGIGALAGIVWGTLAALARGVAKPTGVLDRTKWAVGSGDDIAPENAVRPIRVVLKWLASRDLLTDEGRTALAEIEQQSETDVALVEELVEPKGWEFLLQYYEEWYDSRGIDLAVDPEMPADEAVAALDRLWDVSRRE